MGQFTLVDIPELLTRSNNLLQIRGTFTNQPVMLRTDSRLIKPGDVFIAYKGVSFDGHQAISAAVAQGAAGIILTDPNFLTQCGQATVAVVKDSRKAWAWLAAGVAGMPHEGMRLVGITGTNGKTSTSWLFKEILRTQGVPCLLIGTMGAWIGEEFYPTHHTTPDPDALFNLFRMAKEKGVKHAVMEVSSHALAQEKLGPLKFNAAAITSFSRDHLDFHKDMEDYFAAKWQLFTHYLDKKGFSLICADVGEKPLKQSHKVKPRYYGEKAALAGLGLKPEDEIQFELVTNTYAGSELTLTDRGIQRRGSVPLFGLHALKNFTAALYLAECVLDKNIPEKLWHQIRPVPGRLEPVRSASGKGPYVFVDYAHTPDAVEKTLHVLKPLSPGKLWVVFGCGGDRDQGKRPLMAKAAEAGADKVVVTSDNPRTENPDAIIAQIMAGFAKKQDVISIVEREKAIAFAIKNAGPDDSILIAGKGHEDYQIIGKEKLAFDDRLVAARYL